MNLQILPCLTGLNGLHGSSVPSPMSYAPGGKNNAIKGNTHCPGTLCPQARGTFWRSPSYHPGSGGPR